MTFLTDFSPRAWALLTDLDETMCLADAVIGLKAYGEFDQRIRQLWHDIDHAILGPRMDISSSSHPGIRIESVSTHSLLFPTLVC